MKQSEARQVRTGIHAGFSVELQCRRLNRVKSDFWMCLETGGGSLGKAENIVEIETNRSLRIQFRQSWQVAGQSFAFQTPRILAYSSSDTVCGSGFHKG